jgi:tRNA U54 and U55 pseudouridine synthase Pus10
MDEQLREFLLHRSPICECCHKRPSVEIAHIFIGSDRYNGKHKNKHCLDEENLSAICAVCRDQRIDITKWNKDCFKKIQQARYPNFDQWYKENVHER